jgi:proteasome lid subunit RPN8/RPN11
MTTEAPARVEVGLVAHRELIDWSAAAYPNEACGLLIGSIDGTGLRVRQAVATANRHPDRHTDRYLIGVEDFMDARRRADQMGQALVGAWHSHPNRPAEPSAEDLRHAWPEWLYVIVATTPDAHDTARAWWLVKDLFREVPLYSGA